MNRSIISKGKTVKEAVDSALGLLNAAYSDVEIEIIEPETRGILGIGAKPAVVRVKERQEAQSPEQSPQPPREVPESLGDLEELASETIESLLRMGLTGALEEDIFGKENSVYSDADLSGKVWVKHGRILCKDAPDKYPLVSPATGLVLFRNEEPVEDTVVVAENDALRIELQDEWLEPLWELKISNDKMESLLAITPGKRITRRVKDKPPGNFIQLELDEKTVPVIIETGPIMDKLKELGIVHGVDYSEIARACISETPGSFVVARGTPPTPGKHGCFEPMQEVEIKKGLKERNDGTVDFREIREFPSVEHGQVIGIIRPPEPGMPGLTVTNEHVFPPEPYPLIVNVGRGAMLVDGGTKVVATDAGHPEVKVKGQHASIKVIPKLVIARDITLQTGNVRYIGEVEVIGTVQDGMTVEAQGNVFIHNNANMARVTAGNSIIVNKNIITSEITAGRSTLFIAELRQTLGELIEQMKLMATAIHQLSGVSAFKVSSFTRTGLGPLIKILCNGKFKSFPALTKSLVNKAESNQEALHAGWRELAERMGRGFLSLHSSDLMSIDDIVGLIQLAEELLAASEECEQEGDCCIKAAFALNSQIYSAGNISIVGQGVYNSKLHAGGYIIVDGFVRGGEIYAAKGVHILEAGAKGGTMTRISVPKNETIRINTAMEDTVIQIGTKSHRFMFRTSNVYARLNDEDQLIIS